MYEATYPFYNFYNTSPLDKFKDFALLQEPLGYYVADIQQRSIYIVHALWKLLSLDAKNISKAMLYEYKYIAFAFSSEKMGSCCSSAYTLPNKQSFERDFFCWKGCLR